MKKVLFVGMLAALTAQAELKLGAPFTDGAVLQRGRPVAVWGKADAGAEVKLSFAGADVTATADEKGAWRAALPTMTACKEGRVLKVESGKEKLEVKDVLVGEVWLCSGQSNMDCPLITWNSHYRDVKGVAIAQITDIPWVRYANASSWGWDTVPHETLKRPLKWKAFNFENLRQGDFSAVGFYFGLHLAQKLDVPIGLIAAYCGGTNIDAWCAPCGYEGIDELQDIATFPISKQMPAELKKDPFPNEHQQPTVIYNVDIAPLVPYTLKGAIWYQGEHNVGEPERYCAKMHALYNGWARVFENPDFRFHFVQIDCWKGYKRPGGAFDLQLAQAKFAQEEPRADMVVIHDVGDDADIHCPDKEPVGFRLALRALKSEYGYKDIVAEYPTPVQWTAATNGEVTISFEGVKRFYYRHPNWKLESGFELAGEDGKYVEAQIKGVSNSSINCDGKSFVVFAKGLTAPKKIRYLGGRITRGFIFNEAYLPMGPFEATIEPPAN